MESIALLDLVGFPSRWDATLQVSRSQCCSVTPVSCCTGFALLAAFNLLSILLLGLRPPRATPSHNDNVQASNSNTTTYSNPVAKSTAGPGESANMRPFHTARSQSGLNGNQTGVPPPPAV